MRRSTLCLFAAAVLLAACTEKPQTTTRKVDDKPWAGARTDYTAAGSKGGDQAAWEQQIKARAQGQNEYSRTPSR